MAASVGGAYAGKPIYGGARSPLHEESDGVVDILIAPEGTHRLSLPSGATPAVSVLQSATSFEHRPAAHRPSMHHEQGQIVIVQKVSRHTPDTCSCVGLCPECNEMQL
jgi:hypothetical protein